MICVDDERDCSLTTDFEIVWKYSMYKYEQNVF